MGVLNAMEAIIIDQELMSVLRVEHHMLVALEYFWLMAVILARLVLILSVSDVHSVHGEPTVRME